MEMKTLKVTVNGLAGSQLLMNNPQTVDPLNVYAKRQKEITSLRKKTESDILKLREVEIEAKCYWDDGLGIYIPSRWLMGAMVGNSFNVAKISKAKVRGAVFATEDRIKLHYAGENKVASLQHIIKNGHHITQNLKQGQVSVTKASPMFENWSFSTIIEIDPEIINVQDFERIFTYASKYGGWGDFRPTYGRSVAVVEEVGAVKLAA